MQTKEPLTLGLSVEYIRHSGFLVETDNALLVFDYYQGPIQFPAHKKIYIFSSHVHQDHFNPAIFQWQTEHPTHYILSSDIQGHPHLPQARSNISFLAPYEEIRIDNLRIKAFGSTDVGVSFFIELEEKGTRLFHAGDLNWWHWWGEPQEDIQRAEKMFKEEIAKLKGETIDVAFFPVDPRLEQYYSLGGQYFIQEVRPQIFFPMHFWDDFNATKKFATEMADAKAKIFEITHSNQKFII